MKTLIRVSAIVVATVLMSAPAVNAQRGFGPRGNFRNMPAPGYGFYMRHGMDSTAKADTSFFMRPGFRHMQAAAMGRMQGRDNRFAWGPGFGGRMGAGPGFQGNFRRGPMPGQGNGFRGNGQGLGRIDLLPGLTDKQKKDIEALRQKQSAEIDKLRTETRTKMQAMRDEHRKKMLEILTEEQKNALGGFKPVPDAAAPKAK